jgi:AsmA protein
MEMNTEMNEPSRMKRRVLWTCVVVGLLLLLILTPPLFSVNRLQRRIAASMSASLGRPVHLDRVSLHVLPVPGFTLENLVVSEDPAFGAEPVIRANTVDVTLRPSSLWRRRVEVSSIKFDEPSLNLVRNAQGEWNVQSLLMHAANVNTAPTAQRKAGPEPRFPYIEAIGARVNLKLGEEKKPFSLTGADFALWLPSPQQWRVRLEGAPERTDMNISDPGTVRLEGTLERAAMMAEVPVDLTASWEGAPLGEASKLLIGEDAGWRGNLTVSATLVGKLGAAKLATRMHFEELRRSEFVPVQTMDVHAECKGLLDVTLAVVSEPDCSLGTPMAEGSKVAGQVVAIADSVDLPTLNASGLHVGMTNVPNAWLLDWARLFSQRIPEGERPGGTVSGSVVYAAAQVAPLGHGTERHVAGRRKSVAVGWQGEIHGDVDGTVPWKPAERDFVVHPISITSGDGGFVLTPLSFTPPGKTPPLMLSGTATRMGYTLRLMGSTTEAQVLALRAMLPPLGDGLQEALQDGAAGASAKVMKIDVTCSRMWGAGQTCVASLSEVPKRRRRWR